MKIIDSYGQDVTMGAVEASPPGRILQSRLPNVATAITLISNTAYFVYLGCTTKVLTVKFVEFYVNAAGAGTQIAEVGLFSTNDPPKKADQTLFKLTATGTSPDILDSLTTTGLKRNTTAFNSGNGYAVPAGRYLWAGIRTAMATTQPALAGLCMDFSQGLVLSAGTAGALTGNGPNSNDTWNGVRIALGTYLNTAIAPDLRITLD
jgi:hypothetical protein